MYRWSLCTGGLCVQVVLVYRWSLCTGGPCVQVVFKTDFIILMYVHMYVHTVLGFVMSGRPYEQIC